MFERKMTQTSIEPAEHKSFSSVDVNYTTCELAVWHNCLNERSSFARRRQTETFKISPLCMELLQALFSLPASSSLNLLHPFGKDENLVVHRPFFWPTN